MRKHKRKVIAGHGIAVVALLATSALSINDGEAVLFFMPHGPQEIEIGETVDIDINITSKVPINALGTSVVFPPETLEIVGISKADSFLDLWTQDTAIKEETGQIQFSGGTLKPGGLLGTATALTISVRARAPGTAELYFESAEILASDGTGSSVQNETRTLSYTIVAPEPVEEDTTAGSSAEPAVTPSETPEWPNADLDGNGSVNLVDVSILMIRIVGPYNPRYDLDNNGKLGLSDLSVLFSQMRR